MRTKGGEAFVILVVFSLIIVMVLPGLSNGIKG